MSRLVDFNRNLQSPCWSTLPSPYCLFSPYISNFLLFLLPPSHIQKREPDCYWLQFCLHLFSCFCVPRCLKLLPFMIPFFMLLLFFSTSHTQISNKKLSIVSHGLTQRVSTVESSDGDHGRIVNRVPLAVRDCQPHICHTGDDCDFIAIQAKE